MTQAQAHWRATIHREGVPPRESDYRCWAEIEVAENWLDTQMMETQTRAERKDQWDAADAIRDARDLGAERWGDVYTRRYDPAEHIGAGPFVEALGINYGIEGCECERQAGIDVATVLAFKAADVYEVLAAARERADIAAERYETGQREWRATATDSAVPTWVSMLKMAATDAEQRRNRLLGDARSAEGRALSQRDAASLGQVRVCMPMGRHTSGCGIPARVAVQGSYYDTLDCNWCGKSDITHSHGD